MSRWFARLRQTSLDFARLRQHSHEGARMLPVAPGTSLRLAPQNSESIPENSDQLPQNLETGIGGSNLRKLEGG